MITAQKLAELLYEELERDQWGDIDPYWIGMVADGLTSDADNDHHEQAKALEEALVRVVVRLNKERV